jgi:hypothetical protein
MKTLKQISEQYKSKTLDGRDLNCLAPFISSSQLGDFGLPENIITANFVMSVENTYGRITYRIITDTGVRKK